MEYRFIEIMTSERITHILLNRQEVMNALNRDMVDEIHHAINGIGNDTGVRAVIISGKGGNFAAGADISPMATQTPLQARKFIFNNAYNAIDDLPVPVIAAVSGYALGGGCELALACDIRICAKDAKLGFPEIKLGIFPGAGGTQRLPNLIGEGRAKEMIFLGNLIDAETALSYGLCNRIAESDPVNAAMKIAATLSERPPVALAAAKRVINYGIGRELKEGLLFEEEVWSSLFATEDQKEGMKAFLEKRKPHFKGI